MKLVISHSCDTDAPTQQIIKNSRLVNSLPSLQIPACKFPLFKCMNRRWNVIAVAWAPSQLQPHTSLKSKSYSRFLLVQLRSKCGSMFWILSCTFLKSEWKIWICYGHWNKTSKANYFKSVNPFLFPCSSQCQTLNPLQHYLPRCLYINSLKLASQFS